MNVIVRLVVRLYTGLLRLYPAGFRDAFAEEMTAVFTQAAREAAKQGWLSLTAVCFRELRDWPGSVWQAHRVKKEKTMTPEDHLQKDGGLRGGGMPALQPAGTPGVLWVTGWTLLTTGAIPAALIAMAPLAVMFTWLINLGVQAGFWPAAQPFIPELLGSLISFTLALAFAQWYLLHRFLPKAWLWFMVTGAGLLLGVLPAWVSMQRSSVQSWDPILFMTAVLLPVGLVLGLGQWLYLRRFLPNAFWIIFIDVLAAGSILLVGKSITNLVELMVLFFPGAITGVGMLLLLSQSPPNLQSQSKPTRNRMPHNTNFARIGIGMVALIPLFFGGIWVYAASQLTLAKNEGIYTTVEEAVIARNSQGYGGAEVVRIENVRAGVNQFDGSQPHVWFGGATVYMDRIPVGSKRDYYSAGSYYIHVTEGWVHVPEGAFPQFIGWVMELYNMEGVNR